MTPWGFFGLALPFALLITYLLVVHRAIPESPWTIGRVADVMGLFLMVLFPVVLVVAMIIGLRQLIIVMGPALQSPDVTIETSQGGPLPDLGLLVVGVYFPLLALGCVLNFGGKFLHQLLCDTPEDI